MTRGSIPAASTTILEDLFKASAMVLNTPPTQDVELWVLYKDRSGHENLIWATKLNPLTVVTDRGQQSAIIPVDKNSYDKLIFETLPLQNPIACWAYWNAISVER